MKSLPRAGFAALVFVLVTIGMVAALISASSIMRKEVYPTSAVSQVSLPTHGSHGAENLEGYLMDVAYHHFSMQRLERLDGEVKEMALKQRDRFVFGYSPHAIQVPLFREEAALYPERNWDAFLKIVDHMEVVLQQYRKPAHTAYVAKAHDVAFGHITAGLHYIEQHASEINALRDAQLRYALGEYAALRWKFMAIYGAALVAGLFFGALAWTYAPALRLPARAYAVTGWACLAVAMALPAAFLRWPEEIMGDTMTSTLSWSVGMSWTKTLYASPDCMVCQ